MTLRKHVDQRDTWKYATTIAPDSIVRTRDVAGLCLSENLYARNSSVPFHAHNQAVFWIALHGSCQETHAGKIRVLDTLTVSFLPQSARHSLHFPRGEMLSFGINISPYWLERTREYSLSFDAPWQTQRGPLVGLFMRLYDEFRQSDNASSLAIEGLTLEALAELSRRQTRESVRNPPQWLTKVFELLHDQFSEPLTIPYIAEKVGIHPVHFARVFRQFSGCTAGEYIRQLRIAEACRKLRTSDMSLAAIAIFTGFSDQSHFSRIFKRLIRMTPAEYRRAFRSR